MTEVGGKLLWGCGSVEVETLRGSAARGGTLLGLLVALALVSCVAPAAGPGEPDGPRIYNAPAPSSEERYCAWYGARDGDRLYFGQAPFWSAMRRAGGDPAADLRRRGPQWIGRFDLAHERLLPPLRVDAANDGKGRSGVWDVHVDAGRLYFTTFFEQAGSVDLASGRVRALALGRALNELAEGPDGALLATRYGSGEAEGSGEVIAFGPDGRLRDRFRLEPPAGYRVAPKTPAWDPARGELWVTTDLLPDDPEAPIRHDAYRIDAEGRTLERIAEPEIQFVARGPDGALYRAELRGRELALRVVPLPGAGPEAQLPLDAEFPAEHDFVQDIQPADDGRVVVTRWSGRVHVLQPDGSLRAADLPRLDPEGLYYTAVVRGDRLCATHCADVTVVCIDAP